MERNEPIRVAQIIGKMVAGGVESVVFNYYRQLDHNKIQFDFYFDADSTVEPPEDIIAMGGRFYKLPPYQKLGSYLFQLRKYLIEKQYCIVHSHLNTLSVFPLYAAWRAGVGVRIAHNHSVPGGDEWKRDMIKEVLKRFSKVFATHYFSCSEKAGRWLFGDQCFEAGKVLVVKNAVDFDRFQITKQQSLKLKMKLGLEGKKVIGHVGRFTYAKNHRKLIDIFKNLYDQDRMMRLLLVGDGELRDEIESRIRELELEDVVLCVGKVTNPEVYYSVMDVLVVPSRFEGLCNTAVEAQIAGVPVIISEAIPAEVAISNCCMVEKLSASDVEWSEAVKMMIGKQVVLTKESIEYDINRCAPRLQAWYLAHTQK